MSAVDVIATGNVHADGNTTTLLELIALIDDDRHHHEAAAMLARNRTERAWSRHASQKERAMVSRIRRNIARQAARGEALPRHRFDVYLDTLLEVYTECAAAATMCASQRTTANVGVCSPAHGRSASGHGTLQAVMEDVLARGSPCPADPSTLQGRHPGQGRPTSRAMR